MSHPGVWGEHPVPEEVWGRKGTLLSWLLPDSPHTPHQHPVLPGVLCLRGVGGTWVLVGWGAEAARRGNGSWDEEFGALRGLRRDTSPTEEPCAFGFGGGGC